MSQLHFKRLLKEWPGENMWPHCITWASGLKGGWARRTPRLSWGSVPRHTNAICFIAISHIYLTLAGAYSYTCTFICVINCLGVCMHLFIHLSIPFFFHSFIHLFIPSFLSFVLLFFIHSSIHSSIMHTSWFASPPRLKTKSTLVPRCKFDTHTYCTYYMSSAQGLEADQ